MIEFMIEFMIECLYLSMQYRKLIWTSLPVPETRLSLQVSDCRLAVWSFASAKDHATLPPLVLARKAALRRPREGGAVKIAKIIHPRVLSLFVCLFVASQAKHYTVLNVHAAHR